MKIKKFNEMLDPMGSWDPKQLTIDSIKDELKKALNFKYENIDDRIEQLLKIHKTWLNKVINTESIENIVNTIVKYEKNLNNGLGPLSTR